ncbi:MAG: hypothetical protein J6O61_03060 [Butyrivibrio sp.]|uniref:hypothetical protein n=1 Tax=Butyrivibrio sp. TaxID=28121 RepID=UPI001B2BCD6F|nr:hypothetical protein [Butyrivibrio sp.]MBO6239808.1 hypothetical protein [Butyrivibrio sp.]
MKIKFHETIYNLIDMPNVLPSRFQATIEKGDNTFDSIIEDTVNPTEITVYNDDEEIVGVYTGFNKRIAITIMENVSIELENTNLQSQIDALISQVQTQETAIADLGETVNAVSEVNDTQDSAISDLADAISEVVG